MNEEQWKKFDDISDELYVQIVACVGIGYCLVDRYELKTPLSPVYLTQEAVAWWTIDNKPTIAVKQNPGLSKSMLVLEAIAA